MGVGLVNIRLSGDEAEFLEAVDDGVDCGAGFGVYRSAACGVGYGGGLIDGRCAVETKQRGSRAADLDAAQGSCAASFGVEDKFVAGPAKIDAIEVDVSCAADGVVDSEGLGVCIMSERKHGGGISEQAQVSSRT